MEKLNLLLEKYFRAETSISEETELKKYFLGENVAPELEIYRPLFVAFEQEKQLTIQPEFTIVEPKKRKAIRFWIKTISYSGIAAAILLALWFQKPSENDNYAVISGHRIENSEFANQYAEKKLNRVGEVLRTGLSPMKSLNMVRETLKPMEKVSETREKLNDIKNIINLK